LVVREATTRDARQIAQLHIASWQATYTNELPSDFLARQDPVAHAAGWLRQIEGGVLVQVGEENGNLVGFVACGPGRDGLSFRDGEWEIYNLHVAFSRQGQGIGSAMFENAVRLAREHGARSLILWVVRTNTPARAFYERKGMRHDGGEREHSVGPGHVLHEVRYRMRLSGSKV
jgi:ribosomal protein S18 acetylase RimI-like enzyme